MPGRILVLGATGRVGSALVAELGWLGERVVAASRRAGPDGGGESLAGVATVPFDFENPATYAGAVRGVDRVFLVARPGDDHADAFSVPFLDVARRAGVRRVVNLTAMGVEQLEQSALRKIERHLEASGMAWTHLRPNWFMQVFCAQPLLGDVRAGSLRIPAGDATLSFIDLRDISAVAARALTTSGHECRAYTLTGGEALDHDSVAAAITRASKRVVRYESVDDQAARTALGEAGFAPERVERLIRFYRLVRAGLCSPVSADVERVLGRPPIAFARFAEDHAHIWTASSDDRERPKLDR